MQDAQEALMTSSQCISVFVGCPASPTQLPDGFCLVVDAADIEKKEWIDEDIYCMCSDLSSTTVVSED